MRDDDVKINGRIEGYGFVYVDGDGVIHVENICNKEWCANGDDGDIIITPNPSGELPDVGKGDPTIHLIGDSVVYVELGGTYNELGAVAKTKDGSERLDYSTEIKFGDSTVSSIDTLQ